MAARKTSRIVPENDLRWYMLCEECDAKFFAPAIPSECPRCGGFRLSSTRAVCPWKTKTKADHGDNDDASKTIQEG